MTSVCATSAAASSSEAVTPTRSRNHWSVVDQSSGASAAYAFTAYAQYHAAGSRAAPQCGQLGASSGRTSPHFAQSAILPVTFWPRRAAEV